MIHMAAVAAGPGKRKHQLHLERSQHSPTPTLMPSCASGGGTPPQRFEPTMAGTWLQHAPRPSVVDGMSTEPSQGLPPTAPQAATSNRRWQMTALWPPCSETLTAQVALLWAAPRWRSWESPFNRTHPSPVKAQGESTRCQFSDSLHVSHQEPEAADMSSLVTQEAPRGSQWCVMWGRTQMPAPYLPAQTPLLTQVPMLSFHSGNSIRLLCLKG